MEIGKEKETTIIEPLILPHETPAPEPERKEAPVKEPEREKVPAGTGARLAVTRYSETLRMLADN